MYYIDLWSEIYFDCVENLNIKYKQTILNVFYFLNQILIKINF